MPSKKKLQVFVSSTYTDLLEERQAAVQAILTAGHIPAGMELFAAGDEAQMDVIKRWIDESDVYMLILGGRYGSIEPKSQKSYIQLEYEYAVEKNKPLFAVVIDEKHLERKIKKFGSSVIEKDYSEKLKSFRGQVLTKMVRFFNDPREIKLAILETMAEFSRREDLVGWVPGSEVINSGVIAEEIARLTKENATLQERIATQNTAQVTYNGLSYEEMHKLLGTSTVKALVPQRYLGAESFSLLDQVRYFGSRLAFNIDKVEIKTDYDQYTIKKLQEFGLVEQVKRANGGISYRFTEAGKQFYLRFSLYESPEGREKDLREKS